MDSHKHSLNVIYWNSNGLKHKIHQLYAFMLQHHIGIACICETFLQSNIVLHSHPDFASYRKDRDNNRSKGGVMIIIRRNISHKLLPIVTCNLIENIRIEVTINNNTKIQFISCYLPGGTRNQPIREHYKRDIHSITSIRTKYYALGDFNSKHRFWGCQRANTAGNILYDAMTRRDFSILYPFEHSYYPSDVHRQSSTPDLGLTNCIYTTSDCTTHCFESDHNIVLFTINMNEEIVTNPNKTRPSFKDANWRRYRSIINTDLLNVNYDIADIQNTQQIDNMVIYLTETMKKAQSHSVPIVPINKYKLTLTPQVTEMCKIRNILQSRSQRTQSLARKMFLKTQIKQLSKNIRKAIDEIRNRNWANHLEHIPENDNHKKLWQIAKFIKNRTNKLPPLKVDETVYITPDEKAAVIKTHFSKAHENPLQNHNANFTRHVNNVVNSFLQQQILKRNRKSIKKPKTIESSWTGPSAQQAT